VPGVGVGIGVGEGDGKGVAVGIGVGAGVGVGDGTVPTTVRQLPPVVTKLLIVVFEISQKPVTADEIDGFIIEFAQEPELST
jgi:hypothetical protein